MEKTHANRYTCSIALLAKSNMVLRTIFNISYDEKFDLYHVDGNSVQAKKRIERYELMLKILENPHSCKAISRKIHLKPKYTRRHLEYLYENGILNKKAGKYYACMG